MRKIIYKYNNYFIFGLFLLFGLIQSQCIFSQGSVSLYVGHSTVVSTPSPPKGALYSAAWSSRHSGVSVSGDTYGATIKVTSYFTGTAQVQCDYYYRWYDSYNPNKMYTQHQTTYFNVTCIPVNLTLDATSLVMDVGDSYHLTYRVTPANVNPQPTVRFLSTNNSVATVSNYGLISAKSAGEATIKVENSAGPPVSCTIKVNKVDPQSASITSPISIYTDQSISLSVSVSPSNAMVTSKTWCISQGEENISLTSSGYLTGLKPGQATVYCMINNQVRSNDANVIITEPAFYIKQSYPQQDATNVSSLTAPSVTYSLNVYEDAEYEMIQLQNVDANVMEKGDIDINNATITFTPTKALLPQTNYRLIVPPKAVRSKWGAYIDSIWFVSFQTGDLEKLSITFSEDQQFVPIGQRIHLQSSVADAKIFYTTNGTLPTIKSTIYTDSILIERDTKIRAFAMRDGYENSDIVEREYLISNKSIVKKFPEKEQLYVYDDVNPYVTFDIAIKESDRIGEVSLFKKDGESIEGQVIVADSSIFFVPYQPLNKGSLYKMYIPSNAILTQKGEPNDSIMWTFSTGDFVTSIAMGTEIGAAFKTDGQILTWGSFYQSGNYTDGSYEMTLQPTPTSLVYDDIDTISIGYMHNAYIKNDGSLWMWGRQYCGEFGINSHIGTNVPIKVMDSVLYVSAGGQHTAIIKSDHSLWMVGRNDFGQLGDSSVVTKLLPVKVLDNVMQVAAGWGNTFAITNDYQLYGWGRNDKAQLGNNSTLDSWQPIKLLDDVAYVATSVVEGKYTAVIKKDNSLWIFGDEYTTPTKIMDNVFSVAVGADYIQAIKSNKTLWAMGNNTSGQLGVVTQANSNSPMFIRDSVLQVSSGGRTTAALMHNGSVWTWGSNMNNLLGYETQSHINFSNSPIQMIEGMSYSTLSGVTPRKMLYQMVTGEKNVITTIPEPLNADYTKLLWKCSDENVVSVSQRGVITALSTGEVELFIQIQDQQKRTFDIVCHIIVSDPKPPATTETEELALCPSELPLEWYGQTLTQTGIYTATEKYAGTDCDSVIHKLNLNVYEHSFVITAESDNESQGSVNVEVYQ